MSYHQPIHSFFINIFFFIFYNIKYKEIIISIQYIGFFCPHHSSNTSPHNSSPYHYSSTNSSSPFCFSSAPHLLYYKFPITFFAPLSCSFHVIPTINKSDYSTSLIDFSSLFWFIYYYFSYISDEFLILLCNFLLVDMF